MGVNDRHREEHPSQPVHLVSRHRTSFYGIQTISYHLKSQQNPAGIFIIDWHLLTTMVYTHNLCMQVNFFLQGNWLLKNKLSWNYYRLHKWINYPMWNILLLPKNCTRIKAGYTIGPPIANRGPSLHPPARLCCARGVPRVPGSEVPATNFVPTTTKTVATPLTRMLDCACKIWNIFQWFDLQSGPSWWERRPWSVVCLGAPRPQLFRPKPNLPLGFWFSTPGPKVCVSPALTRQYSC